MAKNRCRYYVQDAEGWSFGSSKFFRTKREAEALAKKVAGMYPERKIHIEQVCNTYKSRVSKLGYLKRRWKCTPTKCTKVRVSARRRKV